MPDLQQAVNQFEQTHPNIKIKLQNVGSGSGEYAKLTNALKAGSGAPDVVQIEYAFLPEFELGNHLAVPTTWAQYAQEATQLHQANPKISMANFSASDGAWFNALAWWRARGGSEARLRPAPGAPPARKNSL